MRIARLAICAAALAASATTPGAAPPARYAEGQLLVLVAPDYPKESLRKGETGSVKVSGTVRLDGSLANPAIVSSPPNMALEDEVRGVVRYWRLQPRLEATDCTFRESTAQLTVWFDIDAGTPKVSFQRAIAQRVDAALMTQLESTMAAVIARTAPEYPWHVARNPNTPERISQLAYARINPDGTVGRVLVAPKRYYDDYREAIVDAARQWRFEPRERGWCAELPFDFQLP